MRLLPDPTEFVGTSCTSDSPQMGRGLFLVEITRYSNVAVVVASYCSVLCISGIASSMLESLRRVAIHYNLITDTSQWQLKDEESEAADLLRGPSEKKLSRSHVRLCEGLLCLCKVFCMYAAMLVGLLVPSR
jgi:hypothetical protein